jgi:predicted amidohydrolase
VVFLSQQAKKYRCYFLAGLVTMDKTGLGRNQAVLVAPGGEEQLRYTKIHPFSYAHEDEYFLPGREVVMFEWAGFTVCPFICYDLRFPEIFRHAVGRGANLFVLMANWPRRRKRHWEILLSARAVENQAYVVGVNRVGRDPNVSYAGLSRIIDPEGKIIARAEGEESAITASPDLEFLQAYRRRFPAIRDRRFEIHPSKSE